LYTERERDTREGERERDTTEREREIARESRDRQIVNNKRETYNKRGERQRYTTTTNLTVLATIEKRAISELFGTTTPSKFEISHRNARSPTSSVITIH